MSFITEFCGSEIYTYLPNFANHKFLVDASNVNSESFSSTALQFDAYHQIINAFCFFLIAGYQNALNRGNFVRHLLATFSDL